MVIARGHDYDVIRDISQGRESGTIFFNPDIMSGVGLTSRSTSLHSLGNYEESMTPVVPETVDEVNIEQVAEAARAGSR